MTTLQDIMGLITKRKIKTPSDKDYIISAGYTDAQEVLKPQPKMEASLLSLAAIKKYVAPTPAYKVYTALVTQTGTNAPVATVLENTIGNIWFTYQGVGDYYINTSNNGFSSFEKVFSPVNIYNQALNTLVTVFNDSNSLELIADGGDSTLNNIPIEIRVYN